MKKSLMFVAVAAAGMLASCSSDSLTAGSDPTIESGQKDLVPIEISVATPVARATTRGTGTVGAVVNGDGDAVNNDGTTAGAPQNIWAGQKVNVYMFDKRTLDPAQFNGADIFNNAVMDTPPATETTNSGYAHYVDPAVPASGRYLVKYYPLTGTYDFWGYRIDDAGTTAAPAVADNKLSVGITVNGTQDVLGAKTTDPDLSATTLTATDLYSAKAARQNIQPVLEFNHLMSRLTFEAYPGNDNAKTVYVTGIKVRALDAYDPVNPAATVYQTPTGTLDIAGTDPAFEQKITWVTDATAPTQFELMKRVEAIVGQDAYTVLAANSWYSLNSASEDNTQFINATTYAGLPASGTDGDGNDKDEFTAIAANSWYALSTDQDNKAEFISATAYAALPATSTDADNDGNKNLIALIDANAPTAWATNGAVSMTFGTGLTDGTEKAPIGESIIAPDAQAYEIEIDLAQKVAKYEDSASATPTRNSLPAWLYL